FFFRQFCIGVRADEVFFEFLVDFVVRDILVCDRYFVRISCHTIFEVFVGVVLSSASQFSISHRISVGLGVGVGIDSAWVHHVNSRDVGFIHLICIIS